MKRFLSLILGLSIIVTTLLLNVDNTKCDKSTGEVCAYDAIVGEFKYGDPYEYLEWIQDPEYIRDGWEQYIIASFLEHGYLTDKIDEITKLGLWEEDYVPPFGSANETVVAEIYDDNMNPIGLANMVKLSVARHYYSTAYNIIPSGYTPSTCKISKNKIKLKEYGPDALVQETVLGNIQVLKGDSKFDKTDSKWKNASERSDDYMIVHDGKVIAEDVTTYYEQGGYKGYKERMGKTEDKDKEKDSNKKPEKTSSNKPSKNNDKSEGKKEDKGSTPVDTANQHVHEYEKITEAATCEKEGLITYTCSCGESYTEVIPKIEHEWIEETVESTCTENGYIKSTCGLCGKEEIETLALADHEWAILEQKEATCTEEGYIKYICSVCGEEDTSTIEKTEHIFEMVEQKEPSCEEEGYSLYKCSICGEEDKRIIPATGHTPTVVNDGKKVITKCQVCDEILSEKEVETANKTVWLIVIGVILVALCGTGCWFVIRKRKK